MQYKVVNETGHKVSQYHLLIKASRVELRCQCCYKIKFLIIKEQLCYYDSPHCFCLDQLEVGLMNVKAQLFSQNRNRSDK